MKGIENLLGGEKGKRPKRQPREAESTDTPGRDALSRSSDEAE